MRPYPACVQVIITFLNNLKGIVLSPMIVTSRVAGSETGEAPPASRIFCNAVLSGAISFCCELSDGFDRSQRFIP